MVKFKDFSRPLSVLFSRTFQDSLIYIQVLFKSQRENPVNSERVCLYGKIRPDYILLTIP